MSTSSGLWICHHCKEKGNLFSFLFKYCDIGDPWATEQVVSEIRGGFKDLDLPVSRPNLEAVKIKLPEEFELGGAMTMGMLTSRFISISWAPVFGIGQCRSGTYRGRVIVPVYTKGELKTFVARAYYTPGMFPKILTPPNSLASEALFGYDIIAPAISSSLIIVEGVFDAMHVMETVGGNVVATLGAHMTDAQRRLVQQTGADDIIPLR